MKTSKGKRVPLPATTEDTSPSTFEEWVAIHGEPEYLYESKPTPKKLKITVIDEPVLEESIDPTGIISKNKQGSLVINYSRFLDVFVAINPLVFNNGVFYTPMGAVPNGQLKQDIQGSLKDSGFTARLDTPTASIFDSLRNHCYQEKLVATANLIPLHNGDLYLSKDGDWEFHLGKFTHCAYRLPVEYLPGKRNTPLFTKWLNDVFTPEDIPTVQEIFGYALVPVTASQEAFFFVGDAGVGKSGVGTILKALLGNAFVSMDTQSLVSERFQVATVENKLVAYDDDLGSAALTETGLLKKLITADVEIQAEKKFADPHEFSSYCRIIASANFMLSSLYDSSDGFYRRLHPILVKNKDPNRKDINGFYEQIIAEELPQILLWALDGLYRVINNGWKIHWSDRSKEYLAKTKSNAVHFPEFISDTCMIGQGDASLAELKQVYKSWCRDNGITQSSDRRLEKWLVDNSEKHNFFYERNLPRGQKRVRGYKNITIKSEWQVGKVSI